MTDRVREACEACFELHQHNCSGFVRAVGAVLGVAISGVANEIFDTIRGGGGARFLTVRLPGPARVPANSCWPVCAATNSSNVGSTVTLRSSSMVLLSATCIHPDIGAVAASAVRGATGATLRLP